MAGLKDIAVAAGIDDGLAQRLVDAVALALAEGERVTLRGLGTFRRVERAKRTFRTALMKDSVTKPRRFTITFKPSETLLGRLPTPDPANAGS